MTESKMMITRAKIRHCPVNWQNLLVLAILGCSLWTGHAAFVVREQGLWENSLRLRPTGTNRQVSPLFAKKNGGKKKKSSNDRYSSKSVAKEEVANHVHQMFEGKLYKKSSSKAKKASKSSKGKNGKPSTIPQNDLVKRLNQYPALILNADFQPLSYLPLSVCHWQEAIKSVFSGKVTVVDVYEGVQVRAANLEIPLPSVIALVEYVPQYRHHTPAFTRRNVFLRDEYKCQYCNRAFHAKDLSIDHVVPRSMGGRLHWENAVTSCLKCNGRKGSLLVGDLKSVGMQLQREPRAPSRRELAAKAGKMVPRKVHPTWKPYLGMEMDEQPQSQQPTTTKKQATEASENGASSSKNGAKKPSKEKHQMEQELQNVQSR